MSHSEIPWISSCEARTAWWYTQRMSPCSWCSLPVCVSTKLHISCRTCLLVFGAYRSLGSQRSECKTLIIYFKPKTLWLSPKNCFFIFLDKGQKKVLNFPFRFPVIEWKNRTFTLRSLPGKMRNMSSVFSTCKYSGVMIHLLYHQRKLEALCQTWEIPLSSSVQLLWLVFLEGSRGHSANLLPITSVTQRQGW